MPGLTLALSGAFPALFLMWVMERFDAKRPEPRWQLRKVAIWGGLATLPCILVEEALQVALRPKGVSGALLEAYVQAAFVEELAKVAVLYFAVWRHPAFDERVDGIVYATRAGLGFALVENIGYLLSSKSMAGFFGVYVMRAALAVPGHAIYAGFMGYWAARKRFDGVGPGMLGGLFIAVALHGTYDAALMLCGVLGKDEQLLVLPLVLIPVGVVVLGFARLRHHAQEALRLDEITHAPRERPRLPLGVGFLLR